MFRMLFSQKKNHTKKTIDCVDGNFVNIQSLPVTTLGEKHRNVRINNKTNKLRFNIIKIELFKKAEVSLSKKRKAKERVHW